LAEQDDAKIRRRIMTIRSIFFGAAMAASMLAGGGAQAALLLAGPTPTQATDSSITVNFNSGVASSSLSFGLNGYASLDGQNYYEDDFSLTLNGTTIFHGTFNLGGGSNSGSQANIYANPLGAAYSNPTGNGTGIGWNGGLENIAFAAVPLNIGANTLIFSYYSLPQPGHAGFQGLGDEGWGVQNVAVAAPEASTWVMMLAGFASLGFAGYRRNNGQRLPFAA
jgi:hypothetical protein